MPCFAASLESLLVFAVIILLSGVSNWLKQRAERRQSGPAPQPRPGSNAPAPERAAPPVSPPPEPLSPSVDWEKELRRLFGEGESEPLPPPRPRPNEPPPLPTLPTVLPPKPAPQPRPVLARSRVPAENLEEAEPEPIELPRGTHFAPTAEALDAERAPTFQLAPLAESASAYLRASQIQEHAAARMQQVTALTAHPVSAQPAVRSRQRSPEIAGVVAQLRSPATARQTMIASIVLGPPKAFASSLL